MLGLFEVRYKVLMIMLITGIPGSVISNPLPL